MRRAAARRGQSARLLGSFSEVVRLVRVIHENKEETVTHFQLNKKLEKLFVLDCRHNDWMLPPEMTGA